MSSRTQARVRRREQIELLPAAAFAISAHMLVLTLSFIASEPTPIRLDDIKPEAMILPISLVDGPTEPEEKEPEEPKQPEPDEPQMPEIPSGRPAELAVPEISIVKAPESPNTPAAMPDSIEALLGLGAVVTGVPAGKGTGSGSPRAYGGRNGPQRASLLARNGGSAHTESALADGLRWLASVQTLSVPPTHRSHGGWDSDSFMEAYLPRQAGESDSVWRERVKPEGPGYSANDLGLTALVLLAFSGAGHTRSEGAYSENIDAAIRCILRTQDSEGAFISSLRGAYGNMYDHALALQALADVLAMTQDQSLLIPVTKGMEFMLKVQQPGGGWDYKCYPSPNEPPRNDLSISGFCIMALSACRHCGLKPDRGAIARAVSMVRKHTESDGSGIYADAPPGRNRVGHAMTAVNLFSRRLLGEPVDAVTQQVQAMTLSRRLPNWKTSVEMGDDPYMWYYAALALLQEGGSHWQSFNVSLKTTLCDNQEKAEGPRRGSWPPTTYYGKSGGGRVYATAMACLCLEVYYRYVPEHLRAVNADLAPMWE